MEAGTESLIRLDKPALRQAVNAASSLADGARAWNGRVSSATRTRERSGKC